MKALWLLLLVLVAGCEPVANTSNVEPIQTNQNNVVVDSNPPQSNNSKDYAPYDPKVHISQPQESCTKTCEKDDDCIVDNCLGCMNKISMQVKECVLECPKPDIAGCSCVEGQCIAR